MAARICCRPPTIRVAGELGPACAAVGGPEDALPVVGVARPVGLARPDVDDAGVGGIDRDRSDGERGLGVGQRGPGRARGGGVGRFPDTTLGAADVDGIPGEVQRIDGDRRDTAAHRRAGAGAAVQVRLSLRNLRGSQLGPARKGNQRRDPVTRGPRAGTGPERGGNRRGNRSCRCPLLVVRQGGVVSLPHGIGGDTVAG